MAGMKEFLDELFEPLGGVSIRRMFGGLGVFKRDLMFGLVVDDVLHLKTDETTVPRYRAEGSGPWIYQGRHRAATPTSYWRVPERLFDDGEEFRAWADEAFAAALRIAAAKQKPRAKKKPAAKPKPKTRPKAKKKAARKRR